MAVEVTLGKIGVTPRGEWSASYNSGQGYDLLDEVRYEHDTWTSKEAGNTDTPSDVSEKWFRNTDSGSAAHEAAQRANDAAQAALDAVQISELPAVALESDVRGIVTGYADDRTPHK